MATVTISAVSEPTDELRALIVELDDDLAAQYPPEQRHGLTFEAIFEPHVSFFIAHNGAAAVGCGGIAFFDGFAEIKRMYVRESARGTGIALALLRRLELEARTAETPWMRLETGTRQPAAIRLYERFGFRPCEAFGAYATMPEGAISESLFYEKPVPLTPVPDDSEDT